ncbi:MAG: hypothetical protein JWP52_4279, partial [Rhizobacter sp.]|nr:hypothetical protein [Rhizobacter sp.]
WLLSEEDERRRSLGDMAKRSTERLQRSLNDALEYADATAATERPAIRSIDLMTVLSGAAGRVKGEPGLLTMHLRLPPASADPVWIKGDAETLHAVVWRLLDVSLRATQGNAGAVQVLIEPHPTAHTVQLTVKAVGGAVPTPSFAKSLALFADSGDTEASGLYGLGVSLEIARLRAQALGAALEVSLAEQILRCSLTLERAPDAQD